MLLFMIWFAVAQCMWLVCKGSVISYNEKGVGIYSKVRLRNKNPTSSCASWAYSLGSHTVPCTSSLACDLDTNYILMDFLNTDVFYVNMSSNRKNCSQALSVTPHTECTKRVDITVYLIKENSLDSKQYTIPQIRPYNISETIQDVLKVQLATKISNLRVSLHVKPGDFCGVIGDVFVYSYQCDEDTTSLAIYPTIQAASSGKQVQGKCVDNSEHSGTPPTALCNEDGIYSNFTSSCFCSTGYKEESEQCVLDCPLNSTVTDDGKSCVCNHGYYRNYDKIDDIYAECKLPSDFPPCEETNMTVGGEILIFEETLLYGNSTISCNRRTSNPYILSRNCTMSVNSTGVWDAVDTSECGKNPSMCPKESILITTTGENIVFNETVAGNITTTRCKGNTIVLSRKCNPLPPGKIANWDSINVDECEIVFCPASNETITSTKEIITFNQTLAGNNFTTTCRKNTKYPKEITRVCIKTSARNATWGHATSLNACVPAECDYETQQYQDYNHDIITVNFNKTRAGDALNFTCVVSETNSILITRKCLEDSTGMVTWEAFNLSACSVPPVCKQRIEIVQSTNETVLFTETEAGEYTVVQCRKNTSHSLVNITRLCRKYTPYMAKWDSVDLDQCNKLKPMCPAVEVTINVTNEKIEFLETIAGENASISCRRNTNSPLTLNRSCIYNATSNNAAWDEIYELEYCYLTCPQRVENISSVNDGYINDSLAKGQLTFNETYIGESVIYYCREILPVKIQRKCLHVREHGVGIWEEFDFEKCVEDPITSVKKENITDTASALRVSQLLLMFTKRLGNVHTSKELDEITEIMKRIVEIDSGNATINTNIFESINNLLFLGKDILRNSTVVNSNVLAILNVIAAGTLNTSLSFSSEMFAFSSIQQEKVQETYVNIFKVSNQNKSRDEYEPIKLEYSTNEIQSRSIAQVYISKNISTETGVRAANIFSYAFRTNGFFLHNSSNSSSTKASGKLQNKVWGKVDSFIIATTLYNTTVKNLKSPIRLTFEVNTRKKKGFQSICSFWRLSQASPENDDRYSHWSNKGCRKSREFERENRHYVECECDHLTNFAMLLDVYNEKEHNDEESSHSYALNIVSLVGCTISIVSLIAVLILYLFIRDLRSRVPQKIVINFSLSLLLLLLTFVLGVNDSFEKVVNAPPKSHTLCHVVASLIHVFLLSTFLWMAVQAIFLYKKSVRATQNRGEGSKLYRFCFCIAWGVPIVASTITAVFNKSEFEDETLCIIQGDMFYYTTLIPVIFVLICNFLLFIPIIKTIHGHFKFSGSAHKHHKNQLWKRTKVTISCTTFLGLAWTFVFFSYKDLRATFQWLTVIFNSLQGFFMFLFYVVFNENVLSKWKVKLSNNSTTGRSSTNSTSLKRFSHSKGVTNKRSDNNEKAVSSF